MQFLIVSISNLYYRTSCTNRILCFDFNPVKNSERVGRMQLWYGDPCRPVRLAAYMDQDESRAYWIRCLQSRIPSVAHKLRNPTDKAQRSAKSNANHHAQQLLP